MIEQVNTCRLKGHSSHKLVKTAAVLKVDGELCNYINVPEEVIDRLYEHFKKHDEDFIAAVLTLPLLVHNDEPLHCLK